MSTVTLTLALALTPALAAAETAGDRVVRARAILKKYCVECHDGKGRSELPILEHARLLDKDKPRPLVAPERGPNESLMLELLTDGSMPPVGHSRPTAEERAQLAEWVREGAGAYPVAFDEEYALRTVAEDAKLLKEVEAKKVRYVSLAESAEALPAGDTLERLRDRLTAELKNLSRTAPRVVPADPAGVILRVSAADAGWTAHRLKPRDRLGRPLTDVPVGAPAGLSAFDLLLLEYPLAPRPADSETWKLLQKSFLQPTWQVRPIAFLRGDWLLGHLGKDYYRSEFRQAMGLDKRGPRPVPPPSDPESMPGPDRLLAVDALSLPNYRPPGLAFKPNLSILDAKTSRPVSRVSVAAKRGYVVEVKSPGHSLEIEAGQIYNDMAVMLLDKQDMRISHVPVDEPLRLRHLNTDENQTEDVFDAEGALGGERWVIWAGQSDLKSPGIVYALTFGQEANGTPINLERIVHPYPQGVDKHRGTVFDPTRLIKLSAGMEVVK